MNTNVRMWILLALFLMSGTGLLVTPHHSVAATPALQPSYDLPHNADQTDSMLPFPWPREPRVLHFVCVNFIHRYGMPPGYVVVGHFIKPDCYNTADKDPTIFAWTIMLPYRLSDTTVCSKPHEKFGLPPGYIVVGMVHSQSCSIGDGDKTQPINALIIRYLGR